MATSPLRKTVSVPAVEASSSFAEAASERLLNLLKVFNLLIMLRKKAQEHQAGKQVYAAYLHIPLLRDPGKPDILLDIDESESFLPFVFNATIVFAVTVLDDLLKSLTPILGKNGNQELVAKANAIIQGRFPASGQGKNGSTKIRWTFRTRYVFVSLCLGLMGEQEAWDALKQPTKKPILDKRFAVLELYQKRCAIVHDDPFADMRSNPVEDYEIVYHVVQRLEEKWNESFAHASAHGLTPGQN
jgi:hypothetical protein